MIFCGDERTLAASLVARYRPVMPTSAAAPDKFRRYRERMKARGLKQVRIWVPDLDAPGAREELAEEIARINAADARDPWIWQFLDQCWADMEAEVGPYDAPPEWSAR